MISGFDGNVPARKPRTQIGRVLHQLTSEPAAEQQQTATAEAETPVEASATPIEAAPPSEPKPAERKAADAKAPEGRASEAKPAGRPKPTEEKQSAQPKTPTPEATERARLTASYERIATLRDRLSAAARPPSVIREPGRTAAVIQEAMEGLRSRLDAAVQERNQLARTLDEVRAELTRTTAELAREKKARETAEGLNAERHRIAADAVAEAEAFASERDQVLAELTEQRRLDDQQAELLAEAEGALAARQAERELAARELAELRSLLDARSAEAAELETRLEAESTERARLESRQRVLEMEVARLTEAGEAIDAIDEMLTRRG